MKAGKTLKRLIAMVACVVMVLGSTMVTHAAMQYSVATEYDGLLEDTKNNCVLFVRYMVPSLPYGLTTKSDKIAIINSETPAVGSVAITHGNNPDGSVDFDSLYGHVAYVEAINGNQITTLNGGFGNNHIERITGTAEEQGVIGYWNPNGGGGITISLNWSGDRCEPDSNNVFVYTEAHTNVSGSFTEAGITVWDANGNVVASKSENPAHTGTQLNIYYNVTDELGVVLNSGTNYTYQIYTVFNGTRYTTDVKSFTTPNSVVENAWTQELSIDDWTYGETANTPSATALYGTPTFTYSTEQNGTYTYDVPEDAGTYYVKATIPASDRYTGLEAVKEFHINKAVPEYEIPTDITYTYGETLNFHSLPAWLNWEDGTTDVGDVGQKSFPAYYNNYDPNYETINNIEIPVTVVPRDFTEDLNLSMIDEDTDLNQFRITFGTELLVQGKDYQFTTETNGNQVTVTIEFMGNFAGTKQTTYTLSDGMGSTGGGNDNQGDNGGQGNTGGNTGGNVGDQGNTAGNQGNNNSATGDVDKNSNTNTNSNSNKNSNSSSNASTNDTNTSKTPKTGDNNLVILWLMAVVISGAGLAVTLKKIKFNR